MDSAYAAYLNSEHWRQFKAAYRKEHEYLCVLCYSSLELHLHHRSYYRDGHSILYEEKSSDVCYLCKRCHMLLHDLSLERLLRGRGAFRKDNLEAIRLKMSLEVKHRERVARKAKRQKHIVLAEGVLLGKKPKVTIRKNPVRSRRRRIKMKRRY